MLYRPQDEISQDRPSADRRATPRFVLAVPLQVRLSGSGSREARFVDLSEQGARIQTLAPMHAGDRVFLYVLGFEGFEARIVWASDMFAGLVFARPISRIVLNHILRCAKAVDTRGIDELQAIAQRCQFISEARTNVASASDLRTLARDCRVTAAIANLTLHLA